MNGFSLSDHINELSLKFGIRYLEKNMYFYYNFTDENTAIITKDTKGYELMSHLSERGVDACNALLGNSKEDVEAAVACSFDGDWSNFENHPVRQIYKEDTRYPVLQLPLPLE